MQQVNDDMDELFRRAAEGYPLNTNSSDWDAVAKKLSDNAVIADITLEKKKNKRRALWLLLLLPLSLVYFTYHFNTKEKVSAAIPNSSEKRSSSSSNNSGKTSATPSNISGNDSSPIPDAKVVPYATTNATKQFPPSAKNYLVVDDNRVNKISQLGVSSNKKPDRPLQLADRSSSAIKDKLTGQPTSNVENDKELPGEEDTKNNIAADANQHLIQASTDNTKQEVNPAATANVVTPAIKKSQKIKLKQREHGLYAGFILSPDLSTVKLQSVKRIGVNMGVIMGYIFNDKISIESGVLWDQKRYYSEGKYFNTKNIYLRPNTNIQNVEGVCYMIEVPLSAKYNLSTGNNDLSISAGLSSYFMKKEKYDYIIDNSGQQYPYSASYNRPTTNIAAVADLSLGYNHNLNKKIKLLVEPYLKIPLKGIGTGNLPIMSSGINIGVTKKLSR